jgi:hypothetical protein
MVISINGKQADIVLENEKTVGDLLLGIENWIQGTGNRLSGLVIDKTKINAEQLSEAMGNELHNINTIDISISAWEELAIEALAELKETCNYYNNASFEEYTEIKKHWEESAAAAFLSMEINDLHGLAGLCFAGEGISAGSLLFVADERIRELEYPAKELETIEEPVSEIVRRMEELPLDVQTGKDRKAAETIQLFTQMGEKLFRLLRVLKLQKSGFESITIDGSGIKEFLNDFNTALGELSTAYKIQDMVLIGAFAEYEMAPRLLKLYAAVKDFYLAEAQK